MEGDTNNNNTPTGTPDGTPRRSTDSPRPPGGLKRLTRTVSEKALGAARKVSINLDAMINNSKSPRPEAAPGAEDTNKSSARKQEKKEKKEKKEKEDKKDKKKDKKKNNKTEYRSIWEDGTPREEGNNSNSHPSAAPPPSPPLNISAPMNVVHKSGSSGNLPVQAAAAAEEEDTTSAASYSDTAQPPRLQLASPPTLKKLPSTDSYSSSQDSAAPEGEGEDSPPAVFAKMPSGRTPQVKESAAAERKRTDNDNSSDEVGEKQRPEEEEEEREKSPPPISSSKQLANALKAAAVPIDPAAKRKIEEKFHASLPDGVYDAREKYNYLIKVVITGQGGVGKTSYLLKLCDPTYDLKEKAAMTIGCDFKNYVYRVKDKDKELASIHCQIWDTAGQENFRSMMGKLYYSGAHVVIAMYDITRRSSYERAKEDIDEAMRFGEPIIMMVGNKADLEEQRAVPAAEAKSFCDSHMWLHMETSVKTNQRIKAAFEFVIEAVYRERLVYGKGELKSAPGGPIGLDGNKGTTIDMSKTKPVVVVLKQQEPAAAAPASKCSC